MTKKVLLSTLVSTVILFVWSAVTQALPWGVPSVQVVSTRSESTDDFQPAKTIKLPPGSLTTDKFDEQMVGKITTLTTDNTFSWIVTKPLSYYNLPLYFTREIITQLLVALLLSLLLWNIRPLELKPRLVVVLLAASATVVATYGQDFNWMGMPPGYAFGLAFNLIVGWLLAASVASKWIFKGARGASR